MPAEAAAGFQESRGSGERHLIQTPALKVRRAPIQVLPTLRGKRFAQRPEMEGDISQAPTVGFRSMIPTPFPAPLPSFVLSSSSPFGSALPPPPTFWAAEPLTPGPQPSRKTQLQTAAGTVFVTRAQGEPSGPGSWAHPSRGAGTSPTTAPMPPRAASIPDKKMASEPGATSPSIFTETVQRE